MQLEVVYRELPEHIFFIFTTICDKHYVIINQSFDEKDKQLFKEVGYFLHEHKSKDLIFHKDFYISPEWALLFDNYITKKTKLKNEMFTMFKNKIQAIRDEKLA